MRSTKLSNIKKFQINLFKNCKIGPKNVSSLKKTCWVCSNIKYLGDTLVAGRSLWQQCVSYCSANSLDIKHSKLNRF